MTGPLRIEVPVPGLVALIGAAGAGKSTLAARLFAADEILSSDELRAAVAGDAADQSVTRIAFRILHREVERRLVEGRLVVVDATNLEPAARSTLLRLAGAAGAPAVAIVVTPPRADVHARNTGRERVVPREVVDRHLDRLAALGADPAAVALSLASEGFGRVHVLAGAGDAAVVTIVRIVARASPPR